MNAPPSMPSFRQMADQLDAVAHMIRMFGPPGPESDHDWVARMGQVNSAITSLEEMRQYLLWTMMSGMQRELAYNFRENLASYRGYLLTEDIVRALHHRVERSVQESLSTVFDASAVIQRAPVQPNNQDHHPMPDASHYHRDHPDSYNNYGQDATHLRQTGASSYPPRDYSSLPPFTAPHVVAGAGAGGAGGAGAGDQRGWTTCGGQVECGSCGVRRECGERVEIREDERWWREWRAWTESATTRM
ncbi:hypothetical protein F4680DRAFT_442288 [Xylaria scruposa]|nr:hypothetical protein F4680DRAFT_442288 [Xylaria scruposa]